MDECRCLLLRDSSRTRTAARCVIPFIWHFGKGKTIGAEDRSVVAKHLWGQNRSRMISRSFYFFIWKVGVVFPASRGCCEHSMPKYVKELKRSLVVLRKCSFSPLPSSALGRSLLQGLISSMRCWSTWGAPTFTFWRHLPCRSSCCHPCVLTVTWVVIPAWIQPGVQTCLRTQRDGFPKPCLHEGGKRPETLF